MNFLSQNISFFLTSSESYDPDRSWRLFFCTTLSVYLNSFNELFLIFKLPFVVESVCKVKKFFIFAPNFFEVFFWKISSRRFPKMPFSLSYRSGKIRYLASTRQPQHSVNLLAVSLESVCKITGFFRNCKYYTHFFYNFFSNIFAKNCFTAGFMACFLCKGGYNGDFHIHYYII